MTVVLIGLFACGGHQPKPKPVDNTPTPTTGEPEKKPVAVAPSSSKPAVRVHFVDGSNSIALEGVIKEAASKEAAIGATVVVTGPNLQGEQVVITDENGVFAMGSLPPGKYELTVYFSNATTKGAFEVKPGKRTKVEIEVAMDPNGGEVVEVSSVEGPPEPEYKTAYEALQHGALAQVIKLGEAELAKSPSSKLHAMLAIARYGAALEAARYDLLRFDGNKKTGKDIAKGLAALSADLEKAQAHLVEAAKDPKFSLELCVACMAQDGHMPLVPRGLFEIERDKQLKEIPEGDKRRRPTYRFDHGDIAWGRAMLSYQQALASLALAYDWAWVDMFLDDDKPRGTKPTKITIKLVDAKKVAKAREQLFAGLAASDEARVAYVAETDDDREWVPSPKQKNYAAPLTVDANLYRTWEDVVLDVRSLVAGETGISFQALWELAEEKDAPPGFIDFGAMLTKPKNIVIDVTMIDRIDDEKSPAKRATLMVSFIKNLIGNGFRMQMKPSRLTDRFIQLRKDMSANDEVFSDKLKYFFWLN
jgi:hypothetical protein